MGYMDGQSSKNGLEPLRGPGQRDLWKRNLQKAGKLATLGVVGMQTKEQFSIHLMKSLGLAFTNVFGIFYPAVAFSKQCSFRYGGNDGPFMYTTQSNDLTKTVGGDSGSATIDRKNECYIITIFAYPRQELMKKL